MKEPTCKLCGDKGYRTVERWDDCHNVPVLRRMLVGCSCPTGRAWMEMITSK